MAERDEHFVKALERGLEVLRAFSVDRRFLTLSEVARATDLTLPVARRFLQTLVDLGYLRHEDQHFTPTTRVLELGNSFLDSLPLSRIALPHLRDLAVKLRVMTSVAVLFDNDVYYVAQGAHGHVRGHTGRQPVPRTPPRWARCCWPDCPSTTCAHGCTRHG